APAGPDGSDGAGDASRHRVHEDDQEDAVDRPRRRLRDVLRPVGTNWMKSAPHTTPAMEARPPMTMPTRNVTDRNTLKASGATKAMAPVLSPPATPVKPALTPKASDL